MKSTKEEIADYVAEAQSIVDAVEREGRVISPAERARAEYVLERVKSLKDGEQLRKAIAEMNGSLNLAAGGEVSAQRLSLPASTSSQDRAWTCR
jgi:F0F1-type ATP synthase membrane subunit b/b'